MFKNFNKVISLIIILLMYIYIYINHFFNRALIKTCSFFMYSFVKSLFIPIMITTTTTIIIIIIIIINSIMQNNKSFLK